VEQGWGLEVAGQPAAERLRLAYVDDPAVGVAEQVATRGIRDIFGACEGGSHPLILRAGQGVNRGHHASPASQRRDLDGAGGWVFGLSGERHAPDPFTAREAGGGRAELMA